MDYEKEKSCLIMAVLGSIHFGKCVCWFGLYIVHFLELTTGTEIVTYNIFKF